ncbi:isoprenylcysteine carboxylmethyltransferase family protein [Candidatus Thorarchaeota archaeon]|nr:MAG: isoprenylcysteine carboxylmethyltransferase family protein [Candidatus Thorarchaeota archaeon]
MKYPRCQYLPQKRRIDAKLSNYNESTMAEKNYWPVLIAVINFGALLLLALNYMNPDAYLWDFIFVAGGVYFSMKFIGYVRQAHEYPETGVIPHDRKSFPKEGIYARIRHPVGAAAIYMNMAYVCFVRNLVLIPIIPFFVALWYIFAIYEEKIMIERFGDEYREYMKSTAMFRGSGADLQRHAASGYGMY